MNKLSDILKDKTLVKYCLFITITAIFIYISYFIVKNMPLIISSVGSSVGGFLGAISPLFIGLIIAYLINPLVSTVEKNVVSKFFKIKENTKHISKVRKRRRIFSVLVSYLILFSAILALIYGFVALVAGQFVFGSIPKVFSSSLNYLLSYEENLRAWTSSLNSSVISSKIDSIADYLFSWITKSLNTQSVLSTITGVGGSIAHFLIGFIISIYLLLDKEFFINLWKNFTQLVFPTKASLAINNTLGEVNTVISHFVRGILIDALIVAILSSIGLSILGIDFAVFIGLFVGICNVIPYFGPILGMIPAFLVAFMMDGFWYGAIAIGILFIVQQIDGHIVYPKVVGSSTGLHPLFVLLSVVVGGAYGGLLGMILAVPVAGVVQIFVLKLVNKRKISLESAEEK